MSRNDRSYGYTAFNNHETDATRSAARRADARAARKSFKLGTAVRAMFWIGFGVALVHFAPAALSLARALWGAL